MFETLSERFNTTFRNLSGRGRITDDNVSEAMREVRTALLEADVHLAVVTRFCDDVAHAEDSPGHALGMELLKRIKLLTHADELDRRAGDGPHGKRRSTARI